MSSVVVLLHHPADAPGAITRELRARGVELEEVRAHAGDPVPEALEGAAGLVVMGGPMSAEDDGEFPFLARERRLIAVAAGAGVPVLGVCLGAQLIAVALGGGVKRGGTRPKEIGWLGVELTPEAADDPLFGGLPPRFTPLHWHGDAIVLPPGATRLARSASTEVQAFRAGNGVYGVQFHLESDAAMVEAMTRAFAGELEAEGLPGRAIVAEAEAHLGAQQRYGARVFGAWADGVCGARSKSSGPAISS